MYGKQYNDTGLSEGNFCPFHTKACTTGGYETVYNHGIHAVCSSTVVKTWKPSKIIRATMHSGTQGQLNWRTTSSSL